ncbi:hypothetical protein SAMN00017405_0222 [Desulfonispora thiosulfatigenes DSM 11270]|uniref:Uncharacterized protein n=1 Tax=Desulfonispora thiosulfatigenes DSM 11270 TaxID=656914 RepID=A0A1W1VM92_DESTI|nr:hypothetical protein [Desulfonispora thiosulfatigenes]SMB94505.1 hypothetical protein SAMN00017405_0222 [Desulfonispora thiosulfatigenes DSM 11270]
MYKIIIFVIFLILLFIALKVKTRLNMKRKNLPEPISSPLAEALKQLIGIAGGIYLSLIMFISFLAIDIPTKVKILNINMDPLALCSLLLAILQPIVYNLLILKNK